MYSENEEESRRKSFYNESQPEEFVLSILKVMKSLLEKQRVLKMVRGGAGTWEEIDPGQVDIKSSFRILSNSVANLDLLGSL